MTLDALAVACLSQETAARIVGSRIQHIHHSGTDALAFECYGSGERSWLIVCGHPSHPSVHVSDQRPGRPSDDVTPLLLRLRKLVDGALVTAVTQPRGERIIQIDFAGKSEDGPYGVTLIVELLGPGTTVILVDEHGMILECSRRLGLGPKGGPTGGRVAEEPEAKISSRRIVPREVYQPPAVQEKCVPWALTGDVLHDAIADLPEVRGRASGRLRDSIVRAVGACSPLLAREAVGASCGGMLDILVVDVDRVQLDAIASWFGHVWERVGAGDWNPSAAWVIDGDAKTASLAAFAPYLIGTYPEVKPTASLNQAVVIWHEAVSVSAVGSPEAGARRALRQALEARLDRVRARQFSLARTIIDPAEVARLRLIGEYLLAFPDLVTMNMVEVELPVGDASDPNGGVLVVPLEPGVGAVANAQKVFRKYHKLKAAAREVPPRLEEAAQERAYLEEALVHLDLAQSGEDLRGLREEWASGGFVSAGRRERNLGSKFPGRRNKPAVSARDAGTERMTIGGFEVVVGRSGRGNDAVLRGSGHPEDPWLHARGVPGAHVLVRAAGRDVPSAVIEAAAAIAAGRSASRQSPLVAVDCTARRHVTRVSGGPPGLVTYRNERTIQAVPVLPGRREAQR